MACKSCKMCLRSYTNKLGLPPGLLDLPVDKGFNSGRVWVGLGVCYR